MGRRLQKSSISLIVFGFFLMSTAIFISLYGFHTGSEIFLLWAARVFQAGSLVNVLGFSLLLCLSVLIFFRGDW